MCIHPLQRSVSPTACLM
ncbi:MAG: hypothetical protein DF221_07635 [Brevibacillus sp.]|nr:hypothetical protein [Brevibacillus sp. MCWH]REK64685.1 MAG: hypothetical protein DF221_07635 [Brevibacillus sp.]